MRLWMATIVALTVLVSACGDGAGLTADEQAVAAAIEARIASEIAEDDDLMTDVEARRCFAEGLVGFLGTARLAELGVTAAGVGESESVFGGMTEPELRGSADVAGGCVDLGASFQAEIEAGGVGAANAACFVRGLDDSDFFQQAFVAGMLGEEFVPDEDALAAMVSAAEDCLTSGEVEILFGGG